MPGDYVLTSDKPVSGLQQGHSVPVERKYDWVKFVIKGTDIDVLDLLKNHTAISEISHMQYTSDVNAANKALLSDKSPPRSKFAAELGVMHKGRNCA